MISAFPETGSNHVKQSRGKTSSPGLLQQLRLRPPASVHSPSTGAFAFQERGSLPQKKDIKKVHLEGMGGLGGRSPLWALVKGGTFPPKKRTPRAWRGAFSLAYCPKNIVDATWRKAPRRPQARCCPHHSPAATSGPAAGRVPFPRSCGSGPWRPCARSRRAG